MLYKIISMWSIYMMSEEKLDRPMPASTALACRTSPGRPAGRTNDVPISVDTPVIYWPFDASASDPSVSVSEEISPPWAADNVRIQGPNSTFNGYLSARLFRSIESVK
jgi:hypothetical protein